MCTRKFTWFIALVASILVSPASAGIFGPSNYEDCVLQGMKGISSNTAAAAIAQACRKKFPAKQANYESAYVYLFNALDRNNLNLSNLSNNLNITRSARKHHGTDYGSGVRDSWFRYYLSLNITNKNDFPVQNIIVGVIKNNRKCSWDSKDYDEYYECTGSVQSMSSSTFECPIPDLGSRSVSVCLIGFGVYEYPSGISRFVKSRGLPSPN